MSLLNIVYCITFHVNLYQDGKSAVDFPLNFSYITVENSKILFSLTS